MGMDAGDRAVRPDARYIGLIGYLQTFKRERMPLPAALWSDRLSEHCITVQVIESLQWHREVLHESCSCTLSTIFEPEWWSYHQVEDRLRVIETYPPVNDVVYALPNGDYPLRDVDDVRYAVMRMMGEPRHRRQQTIIEHLERWGPVVWPEFPQSQFWDLLDIYRHVPDHCRVEAEFDRHGQLRSKTIRWS